MDASPGGAQLREVVVRAIGNDLHMDYSAVGQTTHLAARLGAIGHARDDSPNGCDLGWLKAWYGCTRRDPSPSGRATPVEVFELVGASALRRRLQAAAAHGLTRFVGREAELAALRQVLDQAGAGHGQVVAIVGDAGVGKSRLVYECPVPPRRAGARWRVLVSYGQATPYFPVVDLLSATSPSKMPTTRAPPAPGSPGRC